jgi:tRNA A-37 threonylcarbamoyl transferase component Bud32
MPAAERLRMWGFALLPLVAVAAVGWWANRILTRVVEERIADRLSTVLGGVEAGFRAVAQEQQSLVRWIAHEPRVHRQLVAILRGEPADTATLARTLAPILGSHGIENFAVTDTAGRIRASSDGTIVGLESAFYGPAQRRRLREGAALTLPPKAMQALDAARRPYGPARPAVFTAVGIFDDDRRFLGWFDVRVDPTPEYTPLLAAAQAGRTGEILVVDSAGTILSRSRFEDDLRRTGLIARDTAESSAFAVRAADPGGELLAGHVPEGPPADWPLSRAGDAIAKGQSGHDVRGYRSYLGRRVVGAWRWYPENGIALLAEHSVEEAYAPVAVLRRAFLGLLALLVAGALAIALGSRLLRRERARAERAERLGQYTLDRIIGEGAMGAVYRAHHALLRRPTAVKVLRSERMTARGRGRFEREAQITSRLTHPNTVAIYDYGRSDRGNLYLAMEYLQGLTLDQVVKLGGPIEERRVVHLLKQVAGSLAEAHAQELVHRDIKPQNVMVCHRAGLPDFVKVLDFGLVKESESGDASDDPRLTTEGAAVGTPLYMAPEAASASMDVDARADLYSLGVLAYYMLTGVVPFSGTTSREVFRRHQEERPVRPSDRLGREVAPALEQAVLRCLAKDRAMRPESAHALLCMLQDVVEPALGAWTVEEGDAWWRAHAPQLIGAARDDDGDAGRPLAVDLAGRLTR